MLAHDETRSLKPHLHVPAIGVGLAGAALTDLLIANRVHVVQGSPYLFNRGRCDHRWSSADGSTRSRQPDDSGRRTDGARSTAPVDENTDDGCTTCGAVTEQVLATIVNLRHIPGLHLLLRELGPELYRQTRRELIDKNVITSDRRWGRSRYELTWIGSAAWVRQNVRYRIEGRQRPEPHIDALCALTWALNLQHSLVIDLSDTETSNMLRAVMNRITEKALLTDPDWPAAAIPEVADAIRTAVGALATSPY
ncbi:GOLPH3/VPS74 family protein [Couchioplanes caeruleus]|uniref:GOLPH3/VPS74 family protein n=1 Tax=Couchioplanes caeruleus TaxID=56438 RepID=UPI0014755A2E|nr:GPP34 family phosphoprotein [Couchioplanes caeruleus]